MSEASDFAELESFDSSFAPKQSNFRPGLEALQDGDYDMEIVNMRLDRTPNKKELVLRQTLKVLSGPCAVGKEIEKTYFFQSQQNVDILGGDLCRLKFDADKWTAANGRPFSKELQAVLPKCVGIKFRGKKVTDKKDEKTTYHNLYINSLVTGGAAPGASGAPPVENEEDMPF